MITRLMQALFLFFFACRARPRWTERPADVALSQEKLAELAEVHRNYVGLVERGEQNLTVDSLVNIARALKCKVLFLIRDAGL